MFDVSVDGKGDEHFLVSRLFQDTVLIRKNIADEMNDRCFERSRLLPVLLPLAF